MNGEHILAAVVSGDAPADLLVDFALEFNPRSTVKVKSKNCAFELTGLDGQNERQIMIQVGYKRVTKNLMPGLQRGCDMLAFINTELPAIA